MYLSPPSMLKVQDILLLSTKITSSPRMEPMTHRPIVCSLYILSLILCLYLLVSLSTVVASGLLSSPPPVFETAFFDTAETLPIYGPVQSKSTETHHDLVCTPPNKRLRLSNPRTPVLTSTSPSSTKSPLSPRRSLPVRTCPSIFRKIGTHLSNDNIPIPRVPCKFAPPSVLSHRKASPTIHEARDIVMYEVDGMESEEDDEMEEPEFCEYLEDNRSSQLCV